MIHKMQNGHSEKDQPRNEFERLEKKYIDNVEAQLPKKIESYESLHGLIVHYHSEIERLKRLLLAIAKIEETSITGSDERK